MKSNSSDFTGLTIQRSEITAGQNSKNDTCGLAAPKKRGVIIECAVAIPDFQTIMLPLLSFASDGLEHSLAEARDRLAKEFFVSEAERKELLPSGKQSTFSNRVAWQRAI